MSHPPRIVGRALSLLACACLLPVSAPAAEEADIAKAINAIAAYKYGDSREGLSAAADLIQAMAKDPAQRRLVEKRLAELLDTNASQGAKEFVCRQLSTIGSASSVEPLAKLLADKGLSHMARYALEMVPGPEADGALRDAIGKVSGKLRVGVINSVGARRNAMAVPALPPLIADPDEEVAAAAVSALGKIGGPQAAEALAAARGKVAPRLRPLVADACLLCADQLLAQGKKDAAAAIYREMSATEWKQTRIAAFRGLLAADEPNAAQLIHRVLSGDDASMWAIAAGLAGQIPGAQATKALADQMPKLSPGAQVLLLGALAERGDAAALPAVLAAVRSPDEGVRIAALGALGKLGDASTVPLLAELATAGRGIDAATARSSLHALRDKNADAAMATAMGRAPIPIRVELIRALAVRRAVSTIDALLRATEDPEPSIRAESLRALAALADAKALPALLALLVKAKTDAERAEAEKATIAVCRQMAEADRQIEPVLAALAGAGTEVRCSLLRVLGRVPCPRALAALRAALKDANAEVQDAAVRALAEWPDAEPMGDLLAIARASANPTHKVLAFRGYVRMVALPSQRPAAETLKAYGEAMAVATRAEERKLVLAALAAVSDVGALEIAQSCLADQELEVEAAMAVAQIARAIRKTHRPEATAAVEKILQVCKAPTARQVAESALFTVNAAANIALEGAASSPDPWKDDGGSTGPQAAIDGDPVSFWDEEDNKPLYRFKVTFRQPEKVSAISILGYEHHNYAPKDFEILCDERVVKTVVNAQYEDNFLAIPLGELACKTVELKITGYYGNSPAIRELGIYTPGGKLPPPPKAEPRR